MDIPHKFTQIYILLANNGFLPILEKLSMTPMPLIISHGIAREQSPH